MARFVRGRLRTLLRELGGVHSEKRSAPAFPTRILNFSALLVLRSSSNTYRVPPGQLDRVNMDKISQVAVFTPIQVTPKHKKHRNFDFHLPFLVSVFHKNNRHVIPTERIHPKLLCSNSGQKGASFPRVDTVFGYKSQHVRREPSSVMSGVIRSDVFTQTILD